MADDLNQQQTDSQSNEITRETQSVENQSIPESTVQPPPQSSVTEETPITSSESVAQPSTEAPLSEPVSETPLETPPSETNQPAEIPISPLSPPSPSSPPISPTETQTPQPIPIPQLRFPFNSSFPLTFPFGSQAQNEEIKKKFQEWGIVGHHGLDFALSEGSEVVAVVDGKVIQSGENGDFGISVTIQHPWGQSLYAHLKETKVNQDQELKAGDIIGLSGQTGVSFGPHLHFGLKPNSSDLNNGYLGFIDPSPYLPQLPQMSQQPQIMEKVVVKEVPVEIVREVVKEIPVEKIIETPVTNLEEVQKLAEEKMKASLQQFQTLGLKTRQDKKRENLNKIIQLAQSQKQITNQEIRDLLHVSQSSATAYLKELVNRGILRIERRSNQTFYIF